MTGGTIRRCRYTGGQSGGRANCCYRETWRDHDRCVWHAAVGEDVEKPVRALRSQRETRTNRRLNRGERTDRPAELLDGVQLQGAALGDQLPFEACSLSEAVLSGADLSGATFGGATLAEADLGGATLAKAALWRADLSDANLRFADLPGADLRFADLSGAALWGADLQEADLGGVDLSGAEVRQADLRGADLGGATLRNAAFWRADLSETELRGADLSGAEFRDADLSGADLQGADLSGAEFRDADLSGANLGGADLSEADLEGADLYRADLSEADLSEANLVAARLSQATLSGADLSNAEVRDADLTTANLRNADLTGAGLRSTNLSGADLRDAVLSGADLREANLSNSEVNQATRCGRLDRAEGAASTTNDWDEIARTYYELKSSFSDNGLVGRARRYRLLERHARGREARAHGDLSGYMAYAGSMASWYLTGYGVQVSRILGVIGVVFGLSTLWYVYAGVENSLYYSVITFTTSPPQPRPPDGGLTRVVAMVETFLGTLLIVLLGYVLGNRERL